MPLVDLPTDAQLDAPQGTLADLPSGAQLDTPQMSGFWRLPAMAGSYAAKGALEGVGAIGDLEDWIGNKLHSSVYDPLHKAITGQYAPPPNPALEMPSLGSGTMLAPARAIGAVDRPDLSPQTGGERLLAAGAEGAGGMVPFLPLSTGSLVANAARGMTQGAASGAAGQEAADLFPDHPDLARAAGALMGMYGSGKAFNAGNRVAGAFMGSSTPTLDAYRNLGIEPTLAGDVTGSPAMQMIQAYAAKAPGGASRVHAASENAVGQWGQALEDTADTLGNSRTAQDAGLALQLGARNWLNQFKSDSQHAWNNVDIQIPGATPVGLTNYAQTLSDVRNAMPNAPATAAKLQPTLTKDLLDSLIQDTKIGPLTWRDVRGIRTRIGEKLADPQLVSDTSTADLKRLYGALSTDLQTTAAAAGPNAQAAFDRASALTRNGHSFVENVLSRVLKGDQISPEQATSASLNSGANGGTFLQALRDQMPNAADELAAYKLRDMGLANAGQQNASASRLSPGTFVTDRAKLSPEAQMALFADPSVAQRLQDLSTVASSMKRTEQFLNTSNTGAHNATGHAMAGFGAAVPAAIEGYHLGGTLGALGSAGSAIAAPFVPSWLAARLTTSSPLTRLLAAPPAAVPQSSGLLATGGAYPQLRGLLGYGP